MRLKPKSTFLSGNRLYLVAILATLFGVIFYTLAPQAYAAQAVKSGQHLITIHDRGEDKSVLTNDTTLRQVFASAHIVLDQNDMVEPGLDEPLVGESYQVNVYRARPIVIVDGAHQQKVMSAYQTPEQIVKHAGISLRDEDKTDLTLSSDLITDGASLKLTITRAVPIKLVLYGEKSTVYTQAKTVNDFLSEKSIELGPRDTVSKESDSSVTPNMKIEIWRNGKKTVTRHESIPFTTRQIVDMDQTVGYKKVKTPGVNGKKLVTYEVTMKNGKVVKRRAIETVLIKKLVEQVEVVGGKPSFSGSFADALAKLRSCEGGYDSWNPAGPYYGAYQFDRGTWYGVTSAPYGNATPAQQDDAAYRLYQRRGWSPWPVCGAGLPDVYR